MVIFTLSCFGLLLFVWLSFGGPIPLKPHGYRVKVAIPEATSLGLEADVRVAGVRIGKVRQKDLDKKDNRTIATLELERKFAPLHSDVKAILRQKTLLGETYIELTPGTNAAPDIPENGFIANAQVKPAVELDEILTALDPTTRQAFRHWQQDMGRAVTGRGRDLNDAIGNLPSFAADGSDLLKVLDSQSGAVSALVRNTGVVFGALSQSESQLHNLVVSAGDVFSATASQADALAETFKIFPTFLDESKKTFARLQTFSRKTNPLITELRPSGRLLKPTLQDVRALSPDLRRFFVNFDPLIKVSKQGLPALRDVLIGAKPLLGELSPFLEQLNPILRWLEYYQQQTSDFITNGAGALEDTVATLTDNEVGHYLRQGGPLGVEAAAMYPQRLPTNRGNAYLPPTGAWSTQKVADYLIFPNFDCDNAGGEHVSPGKDTGDNNPLSGPGCWLMPNAGGYPGATSRFGHVDPDHNTSP
ncbi:MAG: phospholipid/cholesterol/gamma-HCH transport system substrate-binding protein [Solirubrobacteraceae bacterium]|nr:phospholipid/cholesterol/gamma-HCH transport system substrate-binding protein [Solirubrobacteraceae bacterium]